MLFIALMATLCGAKSCVDIADFAPANERDLAEIVDLPHGAPSHDNFSRLFRLLDPEEMTKAVAAFAKALREALGLGPATDLVAVGAGARGADGDEGKTTLEALKRQDLKGCVVTADALHRHPKMAEAVRERGGHYALKLKGDNGPLHARAVAAFAKADARGGGAFHAKSENGHDRVRDGARLSPRRSQLAAGPAPPPASARPPARKRRSADHDAAVPVALSLLTAGGGLVRCDRQWPR